MVLVLMEVSISLVALPHSPQSQNLPLPPLAPSSPASPPPLAFIHFFITGSSETKSPYQYSLLLQQTNLLWQLDRDEFLSAGLGY